MTGVVVRPLRPGELAVVRRMVVAELATEPFTGLDSAAAVGLTCVACGADLTRHAGTPVGLAAGGGRVFACTDGCADLARAVLEVLADLLVDGAVRRVAPDRYAVRDAP